MIEWKFEAPDWRDEGQYPKVGDIKFWQWQFIRRNPKFQELWVKALTFWEKEQLKVPLWDSEPYEKQFLEAHSEFRKTGNDIRLKRMMELGFDEDEIQHFFHQHVSEDGFNVNVESFHEGLEQLYLMPEGIYNPNSINGNRVDTSHRGFGITTLGAVSKSAKSRKRFKELGRFLFVVNSNIPLDEQIKAIKERYKKNKQGQTLSWKKDSSEWILLLRLLDGKKTGATNRDLYQQLFEPDEDKIGFSNDYESPSVRIVVA